MLLLPLGPLFERRFGLGLPGQDAFDRLRREGAVAGGAFQGGDHVRDCVDGQQGQDAVRLSAAVALLLEQSVVEAQCGGAQSGETRAQLGLLQLAVDLRMLAGQHALLTCAGTGQKRMACDLLQIGTVDD